jgi:enoyl-CoA hydratase/carnithine racemase
MNGPGKNALGTELMDWLIARVRDAAGQPLLLIGAGDAFSAGVNLKEVLSFDAPQMEAFLQKIDTLAETLYTYPGPTVACVNGHAIAGGCVVALCCDYRVASNNLKTRIGLNELAIGAVFPPKTLAIVRSLVPQENTSRVILGAGLYSPEEALRWGLIDEISDDALEAARNRLKHLAGYPAKSYAATKSELRRLPSNLNIDDQIRAAASCWISPDVKQKLSAALKK